MAFYTICLHCKYEFRGVCVRARVYVLAGARDFIAQVLFRSYFVTCILPCANSSCVPLFSRDVCTRRTGAVER